MAETGTSYTGLKLSGAATAIGVIAIGLWSGLALLTSMAEGIPPFEMLALSFAIAFAASLIVLGGRGAAAFRSWRQPLPVWLVGFGGIFAYHALYFFALKAAPAANASLLAYLWPLLIVLLSALANGERLRVRQVAGAVLGLGGTALILSTRASGGAATAPVAGYVAALACAVVWSTYSVVNRRFRDVPSDVIGGICGLVAVAGLVCHWLFEATVWPTGLGWLAVIGLGLGPVGVAFFAWDHATKYGRLPVLGALSYLAPLLSTGLLILCGKAAASPVLLLSAGLIIAGAVLATTRSR